jgi:hypothetical protein
MTNGHGATDCVARRRPPTIRHDEQTSRRKRGIDPPPPLGGMFSYVRKNRKERAISESLGAMRLGSRAHEKLGREDSVGGMCRLG